MLVLNRVEPAPIEARRYGTTRRDHEVSTGMSWRGGGTHAGGMCDKITESTEGRRFRICCRLRIFPTCRCKHRFRRTRRRSCRSRRLFMSAPMSRRRPTRCSRPAFTARPGCFYGSVQDGIGADEVIAYLQADAASFLNEQDQDDDPASMVEFPAACSCASAPCRRRYAWRTAPRRRWSTKRFAWFRRSTRPCP